ncbi:aminoacyl-tRNA hydrolase [Anaerotignum lactatifermentans]|uniref:Peptidyl-tRNA hydrolase n=1 Tax=Anaerotignum lactatifermentans TaxID=160404 RepID=A0ABS2GBN7_9FIRM|nr:aminoacyl-tRNA hydrolase [Anaerotignum lactatifermentans]MBM6828652.1 aminoacyl-tRNA hydrolase [Anaerotignum lactatifermentans]MBM6878570.1 aminoacyl-tRNA hydrolase [Anaerotignum lactatifermentans]MBM6950234.1 aminoacyl-tRNA hydrolase [Anaerotignum lactatifermentans]
MGLFDKFKNQDQRQEFFVVAGLGNPGREYAETKHNVGFMVIDRLAEKYNINVTKFKNKALIGDGTIGGRRVLLVKPQTFMNLSGESIREIVNFYKIPQDRFVVIFDDTSLPEGQIRLREKGSHGGHNGIRNIIQQMGTDVFWRIKVGIGEKPNGWDLADYVLAKFDKDALPLMETGMDKAVQAVELILSRGMQDAMNRMNQRPKKAKAKQPAEDAEKKTEKNEVEA